MRIALFCAVILLVACGCTSMVEREPQLTAYLPEDLRLTLVLNAKNNAFEIQLANVSTKTVCDRFPKTIFEGTFWVVQGGTRPVRLWPSDYMNLLLHALWCNPPVELRPGDTLDYSVSLDGLTGLSLDEAILPLRGALVFCEFDRLQNKGIISTAIRIDGDFQVHMKAPLMANNPAQATGRPAPGR